MPLDNRCFGEPVQVMVRIRKGNESHDHNAYERVIDVAGVCQRFKS